MEKVYEDSTQREVETQMKIAAGIVTYNPDIVRLQENIDAVLNQVEHLIIVDNASKNKDMWLEKLADIEKVTILQNDTNEGIAKALNQIVECSGKLDCEWTLTLDEDSVVPVNMIEEYKKYIDMDRVAMIVSVIEDRTMDVIDVDGAIKMHHEYVDTAITSGTLMNNQVWIEVGGFTEELFIDYVDFDYCMKLKKSQYKILRVNAVHLLHELGNASEIKLFTFLGKVFFWCPPIGRRFQELRYTTNHSAERLYYVTRNQYYYMDKYKEYIDIPKMKRGMKIGWVVKLIFEKNRLKKWKAIRKGIRDGKNMCKNYR